MGFERFHPDPIVQRNLTGAHDLRDAYLRDLLSAWIKPSIKGWARGRVGTRRGIAGAIGNEPRREDRFAPNSRFVMAGFSSGQELPSPQA